MDNWILILEDLLHTASELSLKYQKHISVHQFCFWEER
ncbi:hypothetical protein BofuT4_uP134110.1 [Botrytis cinerea T4]|uniref:Uncharacterized protein n=1 Tax=Botryotinia fuckeliana (strain T4) TaxID=999810 RepID=G2YQF9_BOTF4|nr:hypothetical protein BofuT4_uP134110.1 [Botrytis cinerea T4]